MSNPVVSHARSDSLFHDAERVLPGGVSAAARFNPALGRPFMALRGEGSYLYDADGNRYIDFNTGFGASLLGHGHPAVARAVREAVDLGIMCALETEHQGGHAKRITELVPAAEMVRFTNTGTETTWHAVRTARTFTGRWKVVKFEGHFHGYSDVLGYSMWPPLPEAGPVTSPAVLPQSAGMPPGMAADVIVLPWNDVAALERTLEAHGHEIAAVIMEPVNYNSGGILPAPGYLEAAREMTARHGVVLIFDEILSGFRTGPGCIQAWSGVTPDMCTLGKCLGGGTVLSAFAGRREVMDAVAPLGPAVHSGTYNANLIPIMAAEAFLATITEPGFYERLGELEDFFYPSLQAIFDRAGEPVRVQALGARFNLLFGMREEPHDYRQVAAHVDRDRETQFYGAAIARGVYFHFAWHHGFSALHTRADLEESLARIEDAVKALPAR